MITVGKNFLDYENQNFFQNILLTKNVCIDTYIYTHTFFVCVYIYTHIYIYTHTHKKCLESASYHFIFLPIVKNILNCVAHLLF